MTRFIAACICTLVCLAFTTGAEARQRHKTYAADPGCNVIFPCEGVTPSARGEYIAKRMGFGAAQKVYTPRVSRAVVKTGKNSDQVAQGRKQPNPNFGAPSPSFAGAIQRVAAAIVSHPPGCPSRAFCGCGAAVRVFGSPIRSLWLAASWFKFPRTAPAPGTVAVRRHHVFVLEADLGGGVWRVYDANSGRHQTRIHARSIAGYAIVNPRAG